MKRPVLLFVICLIAAASLYAGDVASFVNLGFSADGSKYMFGEYGVTDTTLRGYAEIYIVDIKNNVFVPDGVFITAPSAATKGKDAKGLFNALLASASDTAAKYGIDYSLTGRSLYILTEGASTENKIAFRDFEKNTAYKMTLVSSADGSKENIVSSFYIDTQISDEKNELKTMRIGNPRIKRNKILDYQIRRVITSPAEDSIVCIIEKREYDKKGPSIRFMAETAAAP